MRTLSASRGYFYGTHKGAALEINREPNGRFYIIVAAKNGSYLYDGWAPHNIRTMAEAKREARRGACLDEEPAR